MPLPERSYYHLGEVATHWGASMSDMACYVLDNILQVSIMAIAIPVETGTIEENDHGYFRLCESEEILHGPQPVFSGDLWPVFRHGIARIARFKAAPGRYIDLASGIDPIEVTVHELLITRAERARIEAEYGLSSEAAPVPATDASVSFMQRKNYAEIVLAGEVFKLGPIQASVVRQLHEASQTDNPWRRGAEMLASTDAQTTRIVDLFKAKPNWRNLILSDGRGNYRLNLPEQSATRTGHRAYRRLGQLFAQHPERRRYA